MASMGAGEGQAGDMLPRTIRYGVGGVARRRAMAMADELRSRGVAARALFKLETGGWVVVVYGRLRQAPGDCGPAAPGPE
jgi:hypothetical protein